MTNRYELTIHIMYYNAEKADQTSVKYLRSHFLLCVEEVVSFWGLRAQFISVECTINTYMYMSTTINQLVVNTTNNCSSRKLNYLSMNY